jgi:small-conductance mechanosensitive channel
VCLPAGCLETSKAQDFLVAWLSLGAPRHGNARLGEGSCYLDMSLRSRPWNRIPLTSDLDTLWRWIQEPMFTLSGSPVSAVRLLAMGALIAASWWGAARVEQAIRRLGTIHQTSQSSFFAWARVTRYAIWALALVLGLDFLGLNLKSFALLGGALGVGIGFGLQNIFSNFFSGIILLLEKTLKEGDFVDLQSGTRGKVREIGLRYTRITTNDDVDVIVPNSEFINGRVVNWTFGSPYRRLHIAFGVAYGCDKHLVKAAALRAAEAVDTTFTDAAHQTDVWLVKMNDSSLDFELVVWVGPSGISSPARVEAAYRWQVHEELVVAGLEIPFPQRDINIRSGELRVVVRRDAAKSAEDDR